MILHRSLLLHFKLLKAGLQSLHLVDKTRMIALRPFNSLGRLLQLRFMQRDIILALVNAFTCRLGFRSHPLQLRAHFKHSCIVGNSLLFDLFSFGCPYSTLRLKLVEFMPTLLYLTFTERDPPLQ